MSHIVSTKIYFAVFTALMVFTILTWQAALHDISIGKVNLHRAVALAIAGTKASLVILFFMHVKFSTRLTWLVVIAGIFFLGVLLVLTMSDYASRQYLTYPVTVNSTACPIRCR